jgi:hypothetical protein
MALPASLPVADQPLISMNQIKFFLIDQGADDYLDHFKILSVLLHPLDVFIKLVCNYWREHQIPSFLNMPSVSSQTIRSCPVSVFANVRRVVSFGNSNFKG